MKLLKTLGLAFLITGLLAVFVPAQKRAARSVTNSDLEKYREARIKAEEDYRQTYQKLGRPSPEELDRWETERQKRLGELAARLEAERRREEYYEYLKALAAASVQSQVEFSQRTYLYSEPGFFTVGFGPAVFNNGRSHFGRRARFSPNVQMVRDQASMFPRALNLINGNRRSFGHGIFRGGFNAPAPRAILSIGGGRR